VSDVRRLVDHLRDTVDVVIRSMGPAVVQLQEWSGEFRASTSDAPPDCSPGSLEPAETRVRLTKVEADAANPDEARRKLVRAYVLVDELVLDAERLSRSTGSPSIPAPDHRLAARLAFIAWHVNRCIEISPPGSELGRVEHAVRSANELAGICSSYQPAAESDGPPAGGCVAHARANSWEPIDPRYARHQLCRKCGEFKHLHGQLPPPALVRFAIKQGWPHATAPSALRRFGVAPRRSAG
jgi:hypothetical protein